MLSLKSYSSTPEKKAYRHEGNIQRGRAFMGAKTVQMDSQRKDGRCPISPL
jgi:hypothetical protein